MKLETLSFTGEVIGTADCEAGPDAIRIEVKYSNPSVGQIFELSGVQYVCLSVSKILWLPFFESFGRVIVARPV